jgi:hypothetical protein
MIGVARLLLREPGVLIFCEVNARDFSHELDEGSQLRVAISDRHRITILNKATALAGTWEDQTNAHRHGDR